MKKVVAIIIALYIVFSIAATTMWHAYPDRSWDIATHRYGLLIFDASQDGVWVLNPLTNYGDDWVSIYTR